MRHAHGRQVWPCTARSVPRCHTATQRYILRRVRTFVAISAALSLFVHSSLATAHHRACRILSSRDHRHADAFCAESSLPRELSCAPPLSHVHYVLGGPRLCLALCLHAPKLHLASVGAHPPRDHGHVRHDLADCIQGGEDRRGLLHDLLRGVLRGGSGSTLAPGGRIELRKPCGLGGSLMGESGSAAPDRRVQLGEPCSLRGGSIVVGSGRRLGN